MAAASPSLGAPAPLRPRGGVVVPSAACSCCSAAHGGLFLRPPSARISRRRRAPVTPPVRFCPNVASGWPAVLARSIQRGFAKGLSAAGMGVDSGDQAGEGVGDDDEVRITNENLRATIRKSKEVLAMHRNLLEQISEKKKLISVIKDSSIHNEHEPLSAQNDSSFSEGGHQAYIDMHGPQSEFDSPYEEFIDDQNEHYENFEGEDTDFSGSSSDYLYDSFPRAAPSIETEVANGMNQHYVAHLSQVSEKEHSVNVGANGNSSTSGGIDILNIILVAAECAPWSKTGKNQNDKHIIMYLFFIEVVLRRVPETLPPEVLEKMQAPTKDPAVPVIASAAELEEADGVLFGFPTRYGAMAAQMKAFFDSTGKLWEEQRLAGKPAGFFVSTGTQGGGQETTAWTAITQLVHHGMLFVPIGYTFGSDMFKMDNIRGGSPYGAGVFAGDGSRQPSETELALAEHQGKYMASIVKKLSYHA